jgi:hypothetical protein
MVVEIDSYAFHGRPADYEATARRHALLVGAGLRVIRVTPNMIRDNPELVLDTVRSALWGRHRTPSVLTFFALVQRPDPTRRRTPTQAACTWSWGLGLDHARSAGGQTYFAVPRDGTANERVFRLPLCTSSMHLVTDPTCRFVPLQPHPYGGPRALT